MVGQRRADKAHFGPDGGSQGRPGHLLRKKALNLFWKVASFDEKGSAILVFASQTFQNQLLTGESLRAVTETST